MAIAENRFLKRRAKKRAIARLSRSMLDPTQADVYLSQKRTGQAAITPTACSCYMCGNPRKYGGHRTMQEIRAIDAMNDTLNLGKE